MSESPRPPQPGPSRRMSRQFPRFKLDERILVKAQRDGREIVIRGRSNDISEGGLGATLAGELAMGETVVLEFWLPLSREPLQMRARVQYRNGFRYGLAFLTLSAQQRERIRGLARSLPAAE